MSDIIIPNLPELSFEDGTHTYKLNGIEIPSVTTVMGLLSQHEYMNIDEKTLENAANRGTAVHEAIEIFAKYGVIDLDNEFMGYMNGFREWWQANHPEVIGSELRTYHRLQLYAGTVDMVAVIDGKVTLIDFKTTARLIEKNCRVQLEAYRQALDSHGIKIERKMILHLRKDGRWEAPEYPNKDAEAWRVFGSLKCIHDFLKS